MRIGPLTRPMWNGYQGRISVWVGGPETRATRALYPADAEWLGIRFKPGACVLPQPARKLVDRKVSLPGAMRGSFWLNGPAWQVPTFDNADTFAEWLARDDVLVADPVVPAALNGGPAGSSLRTLQRHFLRATGLTHSAVRQIERARYAALLLRGGVSIPEAACEAGYFDQPHLTRSMTQFIGHTPAELLDQDRSDQLSFLYKTQPFAMP